MTRFIVRHEPDETFPWAVIDTVSELPTSHGVTEEAAREYAEWLNDNDEEDA